MSSDRKPTGVARRLRALPIAQVDSVELRVATTPLSRLLGLGHIDRERAGGGLLIPGCRSIHTFGMRFALDVVFVDNRLTPVSTRRGLRPRRLAFERRAQAVIEVPAAVEG